MNMKKYTPLPFVLLLSVVAMMSISTARAADVTGTILDSNAKGIAGALVTMMRYETQVAVANGTQMSFTAVANASGQFLFAAPPDGNYLLCAVGVDTTYLESCEWFGGQAVAVTGTAVVNIGNVFLQNSVSVTINILDPQSLIPQFSQQQLVTLAPEVIVGVVDADGRFHRAQPTWVSGSVSFTIPVPSVTNLGLWIFSNDLIITDESGNNIGKDATTGVLLSSAATINPLVAPVINLKVGGTK